MELIYIAILSALSMVLIFFAFITGLHYGSKTKKNEVINLPNVNPVKVVKQKVRDKKEEVKKEKEELLEEVILQNIDNYDGTGLGQKDIPR